LKKAFLILLGIALLAGTALGATQFPFMPIYAFSGNVLSATDGGAPSDGRMVCFYRTTDDLYSTGYYAFDTIGAAGASKLSGKYLINAFQTINMSLTPGQKVYVGVVKDAAGYGAGPLELNVTGLGFDAVPDMTMALGAGIDPPIQQTTGAEPPNFKEIWFNDRMYHASLVTGDNKFIVNTKPKIKALIEAQGDSGIKADSVTISIDNAAPLSMSPQTATLSTKTVAAKVSSMNLEYQLTGALSLVGDETTHTFTFSAADASGVRTTTEVCTVTVMGGNARVLGPVIFYPSPFSPTKQGQAEIQYTLSVDADLEIFIYSVAGEIVKKIYGRKGQPGGTAGTNKVKWDGKNTYGNVLGNGIYNGTIYDPAQGKTLQKFKATFFH
jgi:flagellar hook assembly protein FlgD